MQIFEVIVKEIRYITGQILELEVTTPLMLEFMPGQFFQFLVAEKTWRAYSIASLPSAQPSLLFCIKLEPDGFGSNYIRQLKVGDKITARGPLGKFVVTDTTTPVIFAANGVGVAPFRAMVPALLASTPELKLTLVFGVRSRDDIFYHNFFGDLAERQPSFTFIPLLSRPDSLWQGEQGRVTHYLDVHYEDFAGAQFFLCGSLAMVQDARAMLIGKQVNQHQIHLEIFD